MVSGEYNVSMQLPSPTMKQPVSDQSLSKAHISPSRHNFRSARSSRRKSSDRNRLPSVRAYDNDMNEQSSNTNSPYYKGLLDQSLAVNMDTIAPYSHPHTPITHHDLLSSPYYKGLTDYSKVIGNWTAHTHNHPIPIPIPSPNNSLYTSSPYYRGLLTGYTLVIHAPPIQPPFPNYHPTSIKTREHIVDKLSAPSHTSSSLPMPKINTDSTLKDYLMAHAAPDLDFLTQQDRVAQESQFGNMGLEQIAEKTTLEELELMSKGIDEEKPLRESESESEIELMTNVELVTEEKPLRERILEQASDNKVEAELDETVLEETKVITEEKPLRERVSETSNVVEMDVWKEEEKGLSVSEQTQTLVVASESQCKEGENVFEYIWATKYEPKTLEEFICNKDKALQLKAMVKEGCGCSHFIFEGPPSVGKRSMIRAMLREVFGADGVQVAEECKNFNLKGEMVSDIQVRVKKSVHHVEVNLSETKGYEKHVIVDLFKETYGRVINNSQPCCPENCKAIVLYEAEKLSIESLLYIKWLLEKYKGCNKVFFCCSDESKLQPVKPLCITLRLESPSTQELVNILEYIGKEEGIQLSHDLVEKIISRSKNNLRQAIRSLEATCRNKDALTHDDLILTGWEEDILNIARKIIQEQSPRQLYVIRRKLQSLMIHDVPPDFVYKFLIAELTNLVDESLRAGVAKLDKEFNRASEIKFETMKNNDSTKKNPLTYLKVEEFIAKFMSWYKNSCEKGNKHVQHIAGA